MGVFYTLVRIAGYSAACSALSPIHCERSANARDVNARLRAIVLSE
jgi:hypothetical protein